MLRTPTHPQAGPHSSHRHAALRLALVLALAAPCAHAVTLPAGFVTPALPFVFDRPTSLAFLPDGGLLVAEKGGIVYVVRGSSRWAMWVHEEEVLNADDRGLLAVAVDPKFRINRRLYFLLAVDPDSNGVELDHFDDTFGRLVRYEVSATDSNRVDESTRTVLIGRTWAEGFPSGSGTHTIAALEWGADGSLLVSAGDGAHFSQMDPGGLDPGLFAPGRTDSAENIGAFRAQDLESLDGKVLRIDPNTGAGFASNPYFDGNPFSNRSRVWSYGHRNPFRIARRPGTGLPDPAAGSPGTLYVGDVGWSTWEELDVVRVPGANFGWPCYEGPESSPPYQGATPAHHGCPSIGSPENPALPTAPVAWFHHEQSSLSSTPGVRGGVIAGGMFYTGAGYPSSYQGAYFFGDYVRDWIKVLHPDGNDQVIAIDDFGTGAGRPVAFAADPAGGDVYYAAIGSGEVRRIRYVGPTAVEEELRPEVTVSRPVPNPARGAMALSLDLPAIAAVRLIVHDVSGREVWRGPRADLAAGRHDLVWAGVSTSGEPVRTGVYLARVEVGGRPFVRRVVVMR